MNLANKSLEDVDIKCIWNYYVFKMINLKNLSLDLSFNNIDNIIVEGWSNLNKLE